MKPSSKSTIKPHKISYTKRDIYSGRLSNKPQTGFHESFRTSDEFFRQLVESLDDYAIFTTDTKGNISSWNSGAKKILGYSEKEIIGKNSSVLFIKEDLKRNADKNELITALKMGRSADERWHVRKDKSKFWGSGLVFPLYDTDRTVRGFTKVMRDLTDRKIAYEQEKRFRSVIENSSDGIRFLDKKGKIIYASPSTKRILGYSANEYLNHQVIDLIHPDDKKRYRHAMKSILNSPGETVHISYRIQHKNGTYRWMEGVGTNLLNDPTVNAIVSNFRDITDRKNAEEEKERILRQFTTILEQLPAGVIIADAKTGKILLTNKQVRKTLGVKEVSANSFNEYSKYPRFFLDGREYTPKEWPLSRAMLSGESIKNEEIKIKKSDGTYGYISVSAGPITDIRGNITSGVSAFIDITEKKNIESRKDEFMSLASHELKTPLTSLSLFTDMLRKSIKEQKYETAQTFATKIKLQSSKLTELVNDLLDVSRIETGKMRFRTERFDLHELLQDIVDDMQYTTSKHTITCNARKSLFVHADRYRIYQVLTNLLTNAIKYSPDNTPITVTLKKKGDFAQVSVVDKGIGVPKELQQKIFDKLYQIGDSKEKTFIGLGMGLYISKEIITRHGGTIWVKSKRNNESAEKNSGSDFHFTLPLHDVKK